MRPSPDRPGESTSRSHVRARRPAVGPEAALGRPAASLWRVAVCTAFWAAFAACVLGCLPSPQDWAAGATAYVQGRLNEGKGQSPCQALPAPSPTSASAG